MAAQAAGIFMEGDTQLTLTESAINGNHLVAKDPVGEPLVYAAALHYQYGGDGLLIRNTTISGNTLVANLATTQEYEPSGGVLETDGHAVLHAVTVWGNTQDLHTSSGPATLGGPVQICGCDNGDGGVVDLSEVVVSRNLTTAISDSDAAQVWGGGIFAVDGTRLTIRGSQVSHNRSVARAIADPKTAAVYGGGVWVGPAWGTDPVVDLGGSPVTRNVGVVSKGGEVHGGGLYAEVPVAGTSGVTHNVPNDLEAP